MTRSVSNDTPRALHLGRALKLLWRISPGWTSVNASLALVQGVLPLAALYLMKRIVDAVAAATSSPDKAASFEHALPWIAGAGVVAVAGVCCRALSEMAVEAQSLTVSDEVADVLHVQSAAVDLEFYEDPDYYDALHRAQAEAPYRPQRIVNELIQIAQGSITLAGIAGLLLAFNPLLGLALFVVALPAAVVRQVYSRRLYALQLAQTEPERKAWYYHWLLTDSRQAKEVRLFSLGDLLRGRFLSIRRELRGAHLSLSRKRALRDTLAQGLATAALFAAFAQIAREAIVGAITLGAMIMYFQGFQSGLSALQGVLRNASELMEDNLFLSNFYRFLGLKPRIVAPGEPAPLPAVLRGGVVFDNVSFAYPGRPERALRDIQLTLAPGEVIALVGENGSGKSTLVKLLCRLYDPTGGAVRIDGTDLRDTDPVLWRKRISVLFQDYVQYHLTAAENIWLGNVDAAPEPGGIARAAERAGVDGRIGRLPSGYDTVLGRWFSAGHELSIGEWQKIALARTFWRDAEILVLDEPSASLDPIAEAELFSRFRTLIEGRSAVLISHRFSTVRMADRIYVLENGAIAEEGSHAELCRRGGIYARAYAVQAAQYGLDPAAAGSARD